MSKRGIITAIVTVLAVTCLTGCGPDKESGLRYKEFVSENGVRYQCAAITGCNGKGCNGYSGLSCDWEHPLNEKEQ